MKKILFAVFAHPDDESFGPCGTLLQETKAGTELHLITLTSGEAGANPDNHTDLASVRRDELAAAGALLGATKLYNLGLQDGRLCNIDMLNAVEQITTIISEVIKDRDDVTIEFMSSDLNGITGHIDHIVAARSTCLVFYRLKAHDSRVSKLRLTCLSSEMLPKFNTDWLFMEAGRSNKEIAETIDARENLEEIINIMRCHKSQRSDLETHLNHGETVAINHFIVLE